MTRDTLVIVRPRDRVDQTRDALAGAPYSLHAEDVLSYQPLSHDVPAMDDVQAVIITSIRAPQAMAHLPPDLLDKPLYVVGDASAARAKAMGFRRQGAVAPTVEELRQTIRQNYNPQLGPLLYLRGDQIAFDLADDLSRYDYSVLEHICYTTTRRDTLSDDLLDLLDHDRVRAVLLFSKASATHFRNLIIKNARESTVTGVMALCLSKPVLECVHDLPWERTYAAHTPDLGAMVDLVRTLPAGDVQTEGTIANDDDSGSKRSHSER